MKVLLNPTYTRKTFLPLIAATMLSTAALANTNNMNSKNSTRDAKIEFFNKDTFEKADINKDHALSYTEFVSIPDKKNTETISAKDKVNLNKSHYFGLIIFSIAIAAFDILRNATEKNNDEKKNP